MPFEPLTHIKTSLRTGKPLSKISIKIYKSLLNRLAQAEIDTKAKLIENPEEVITIIDFVVEGEGEVANSEKRKYYSAIFYALDEYPNEQKALYYQAFLKAKGS
jgi:hypothetical protein